MARRTMTDAISQLASVQHQQFVFNSLGVASFVVLYYDYLLTLPLECSRYWSAPRITWASAFFYVNRYLSLLAHIPVMFRYFWTSSDPDRIGICIHLSSFHQYLAQIMQGVVAVLLIMRTYALYSSRLAVLLVLCILSLATTACGVWRIATVRTVEYSEENLPLRGCLLPISQHSAKKLAFAWTMMFSFEVVIFFMTLYKSLTFKRHHNGSSTIVHVMFRDGNIYFGVMMAAFLAVILSLHLSPAYERRMSTPLANVLSTTMISRLMLNIHDPRLGCCEQPSTYTLPIFSSFIDMSPGPEEDE